MSTVTSRDNGTREQVRMTCNNESQFQHSTALHTVQNSIAHAYRTRDSKSTPYMEYTCNNLIHYTIHYNNKHMHTIHVCNY